MRRNFLSPVVGIAMTKAQLCFCTGLTPYKLKTILKNNPEKWKRLGLGRYDKLLMPIVVQEVLAQTKLQIDLDLYTQYVAGSRRPHPSTSATA